MTHEPHTMVPAVFIPCPNICESQTFSMELRNLKLNLKWLADRFTFKTKTLPITLKSLNPGTK